MTTTTATKCPNLRRLAARACACSQCALHAARKAARIAGHDPLTTHSYCRGTTPFAKMVRSDEGSVQDTLAARTAWLKSAPLPV